MTGLQKDAVPVRAPAAEDRLRLAFLTDIITPYQLVLFEELATRADLTAVFCSRTGTRAMGWRLEVAVRHEVVEGLTIRRRSPDATDYYISPRILAALCRARPDVVISAGFSIPTLYAAAYCQARKIPLLIQSDGTSRSEANLGVEQRLSRSLIGRLAWGAVANSEPAARRFAELGFASDHIFLAPHVIRVGAYWHVAQRREMAAHTGPLRLLYVGRFIPRKGCDWLLRGVAQACRQGTNLELTMVGSGSGEAALRALATELDIPVRWRGFVDQPDLPAVYADADAFVLPTLDDPFGIVLLEAAAAGLALIASPHAGATEDLVQEGVNGFVVEPRDVDRMASSIARLADDSELRISMGRAAHAATLGRTPSASADGYVRAARAALSADRTDVRLPC